MGMGLDELNLVVSLRLILGHPRNPPHRIGTLKQVRTTGLHVRTALRSFWHFNPFELNRLRSIQACSFVLQRISLTFNSAH